METQTKNRSVLSDYLMQMGHKMPVVLGSLIVTAALLGAQGYGLANHFADYAKAPPTVSRLLLYPEVETLFAQAMIISAVFLCISVCQVATLMARHIQSLGHPAHRLWVLLCAAVFLELIAIAGMIVLSQFTGRLHARLHDVGSYMLFFGHAFGISLSGLLIRSILVELKERAPALAPFPRRALRVAGISVLYGIVYFGGKFLPDSYFFWQRLALSVLEIVVILHFLAFLFGFRPLLAAKPA